MASFGISDVEQAFMIFPVLPGRCQDSTLNYAITASFHILSKSLFTNNSIIQHAITLATESTIK
jgi:hypothetical protein